MRVQNMMAPVAAVSAGALTFLVLPINEIALYYYYDGHMP